MTRREIPTGRIDTLGRPILVSKLKKTDPERVKRLPNIELIETPDPTLKAISEYQGDFHNKRFNRRIRYFGVPQDDGYLVSYKGEIVKNRNPLSEIPENAVKQACSSMAEDYPLFAERIAQNGVEKTLKQMYSPFSPKMMWDKEYRALVALNDEWQQRAYDKCCLAGDEVTILDDFSSELASDITVKLSNADAIKNNLNVTPARPLSPIMPVAEQAKEIQIGRARKEAGTPAPPPEGYRIDVPSADSLHELPSTFYIPNINKKGKLDTAVIIAEGNRRLENFKEELKNDYSTYMSSRSESDNKAYQKWAQARVFERNWKEFLRKSDL